MAAYTKVFFYFKTLLDSALFYMRQSARNSTLKFYADFRRGLMRMLKHGYIYLMRKNVGFILIKSGLSFYKINFKPLNIEKPYLTNIDCF